jgi:putative transcriptional regulator
MMSTCIRMNLDRVMARQGVTLTELAGRVGLTLANLSILKNNRARAIRFSTLQALCRELRCQPGDLLAYGGPVEPGTPEPLSQTKHPSERGLPGDYY